jgi:hypothetical protein
MNLNCWKLLKLKVMNSQKCTECKDIKSFDKFNKSKNQPNGLHAKCKDCRKKYRLENRTHIIEKSRKYYNNNKNSLLVKNSIYRKDNKDIINTQRKEYRNRPEIKLHIKEKNKEYLPIRKIKIKERRKVDKDFQLSEIIRSKYHKMIKGRDTSYREVLGCDFKIFRKWLEFQFNENMNWDNLGSYWQIDHILAINLFDNFDTNELNKRVCFNWTNLQPLFKNENRQKSDKLHLHYYMNSIVNVHRFAQLHKDLNGYQRLDESLIWLRENTQKR